jgi:hypothetical protein
MTKDEALRLALEALENIDRAMPFPVAKLAIKECKAALEAKDDPDYKALWQQMCERCDDLDKELAATDRQVEILSDSLSQSRKQQNKPVAWRFKTGTFWNREVHWRFVLSLEGTEGLKGLEPLYTTPPQRTWVGLTAEEKSGQRPFGNGLLFNSAETQVWELAVDYAEAKLKEKNT